MESGEAFRIVDSAGKIIRIYRDGRTEGLEQPALVVNRIPALQRQAFAAGRDSADKKAYLRLGRIQNAWVIEIGYADGHTESWSERTEPGALKRVAKHLGLEVGSITKAKPPAKKKARRSR